MISLKYLFLKKLSTGYDEQENHRKMMDRLRSSIEESEKILKEKEDMYQSIQNERTIENERKNEEILNCKNDLINIRKQETEKLEQMKEEDIKRRKDTTLFYQEREKNLRADIDSLTKELEELEKKNDEEEAHLNKINDDYEKRIENVRAEYETTVGGLKKQYEESKVYLLGRT